MKTQQLIWFIDSRFFYQTISLDKIVHLANAHHKKIKIIINARAKSTDRWYSSLLTSPSSTGDDPSVSVNDKKTKLLNYFSMNAIKAEIIISQSLDYLPLLNTEIAKEANSLVIIEDAPLSKRHPIFQLLTQVNASVLILTGKRWKQPIKVVGAVDPLHENARPENIDESIVAMMQQWELLLKAQWSIAHCCHLSPVLYEYKNKIKAVHQDGLAEFATKLDLKKNKYTLLDGLPEEALTAFIKDQQIDVVFIGLVARNKLEQLWIGSTTTALLSDLPCDMLLIKD